MLFICRQEILLNIDPVLHSYAVRVGDMKLIFGKSEGTKYGGWIKPSEIVESEIELIDGTKMKLSTEDDAEDRDNDDDDDDETPAHLLASPRIRSILKDLGRVGASPHPAVVDCGSKPANASTNCNVAKAPCLYNIREDPCEYNNLANEMPEVLRSFLIK